MSEIKTWEEMESSGKYDDYGDMAREFARKHVIEALKSALSNAYIEDISLEKGDYVKVGDGSYKHEKLNKYVYVIEDYYTSAIKDDSILNAYPLENIK